MENHTVSSIPNMDTVRLRGTTHPDRHYSNHKGLTLDPAIPVSSQPQSALLSLPGEIRNMIMEYVLTSEKALTYSQLEHTHGTSKSVQDVLIDRNPIRNYCERKFEWPILQAFNQTKYVCRQLWLETVNVEYRCNTVKVHGENPLMTFLDVIARHDELEIKHVIMNVPRFDMRWSNIHEQNIEQLMQYCIAHPAIRIDIVIHKNRVFDRAMNMMSHFRSNNLVIQGIRLTKMLHGVDLGPTLIPVQHLPNLGVDINMTRPGPTPNLSIMLTCHKTENHLRYAVGRVREHDPVEYQDARVKYAAKWFNIGI